MNFSTQEAQYWNEEGGWRWVANIERTEAMLAALTDYLFERLALKEREHVLDIGCGGGATSREVAERVGPEGRVLGVDISTPILEIARSRGGPPHLDFLCSDAATADLGSEVFDLITSRFGVMFFPDPVAAFANVQRALKPDGRMVFMCWRAVDENPWIGKTAAAACEELPKPEGGGRRPEDDPYAPGPFSLAEAQRLQEVLDAAGFREIALEGIDEFMRLGTPDDAASYLTSMGPAAAPFSNADESQRAAALAAVRRVLRAYDSAEGIHAPCAAWIVSARKGARRR